jgi:acyl-CoA synthetase (AMP-forming)/AMP-acid ligase II
VDVTNLMRRTVRFNADREAVVYRDRHVSFAEQWRRSCRLAHALIDMGLRPGDRVGVLEDNSLEAADLFCGAAIANLAKVPLYPRNSRDAHVHMLSHTGCRVLVVSGAHAADAEGLVDEVPSLERIVVRDDGYEDWLAGWPDEDPMVPTGPDDVYIIRHTGGTTGPSKGVAYTHKAWLDAGRDWFYLFPPVEPGDRCLHVGPISHGSGYLFVPVWLAGGSNVLVDHFEAEEVLDLMERLRIAYAFMVPTMINVLVRHPSVEGRDWSALKCLQTGASPIADDTALRAHQVFGDRLWQGYGQTEAVPVVMMGPRQWFADAEGSQPLRAAGLPLPFADIAILDPDTHEELPDGTEGEIAIRCDGQMSGFWENEAATAERIHEGWVLTGDIGRLDRNGYLYVVDRKDDMIISGGYNIWPAELENVLTNHAAVIEAAVFGIPSERWGESPMAVCTIDDTVPVSAEELIALCAEQLGSYKKPAQVELTTDPLPKSPVGKILRKQLREPHWVGHERRVAGS